MTRTYYYLGDEKSLKIPKG